MKNTVIANLGSLRSPRAKAFPRSFQHLDHPRAVRDSRFSGRYLRSVHREEAGSVHLTVRPAQGQKRVQIRARES